MSSSKIVRRLRNRLCPRVTSRADGLILSLYEKESVYLELMLKEVVIGDQETGVKRSNSVIVYGPVGSGKTTFVGSTLAKLSESEAFANSRMIVNLNGKLCPDFRSAVEEICWQLKFPDYEQALEGIESAAIDELQTARNFDDRLEQTMEFLRTSMKTLNKSIVFILDKLELFVDHANQGLLYNLFDLASNAKSSVPILIIGLTSRMDLLELFEKRVKSRFSHRQIKLLGKYEFPKYQEIVQDLLFVPDKDAWNKEIHSLLGNIDTIRLLRCIFDTDKSIGQLVSFLYIVSLEIEKSMTLAHLQNVFQQKFKCDSHVKVVLDFTVSELVVILAIYKQMQNNNQKAWQPNALFKIVERICSSYGINKVAFLKTVSKLESLELVVPMSGTQSNLSGANNKGESYFKCEIPIAEFQEIWKQYPQIPSSFTDLL